MRIDMQLPALQPNRPKMFVGTASSKAIAALCATLVISIALARQAVAETSSGLMTFQVVRSTDPNCETSCPEWIFADGKIRIKTVGEFRRFLNRIPNKRLPVIFNSAGGDVDAAIEIGREIRRRKLDTGIGLAKLDCANSRCDSKAAYLPGRITNEPADCNSACLYAFSGGVLRYNEAGNYVIAVNGIRFEGVKNKKTFLKKLRARTRSYLSEMGVDTKLVSLMEESDKPYDIPFKEQQSLNLVTTANVKEMLNASACSQNVRPAYCIAR